jgi:sensor histidine kinase regulating citrate/malate metabolism
VSAGLIFLIVALVCVILFAVVTFAVVVMIKNALSRAADRALNVAQGMAGQAVGRAVEIGAQQLIQGAQTMSEEAKRRDPS